jgi:hypothetical protein
MGTSLEDFFLTFYGASGQRKVDNEWRERQIGVKFWVRYFSSIGMGASLADKSRFVVLFVVRVVLVLRFYLSKTL